MRILYSKIEKKHIYADQNQRKGSGLFFFLFFGAYPRRTLSEKVGRCRKQAGLRWISFKNRTENNSQKEVQKLRYDSTNP